MFFTRIFSLIGGKLSRWLKAREARDPEAVYEAAISERLRRYNQLKTAAAGVIYMRNKLARELKQKSVELTEVAEQAAQAADMNEDECALILLRRKHELGQDCARLKDDLSELTTEADEAKKNLIAFKGEIEKLKVEKVRMLARLKNAQALEMVFLPHLPVEPPRDGRLGVDPGRDGGQSRARHDLERQHATGHADPRHDGTDEPGILDMGEQRAGVGPLQIPSGRLGPFDPAQKVDFDHQ